MAIIDFPGDNRRAAMGGVIAFVMVFLGMFLFGKLGKSEAFIALKEMRPSLRFICSAIMTATSTILALILTLLSFSTQTERNLKTQHYKRIELIARLATIAFAGAIVFLMLLTLPLDSADKKLRTWYISIYYFSITYAALLGGVMFVIITMLYQAANAIITLCHPDRTADHLFASEEVEEQKE